MLCRVLVSSSLQSSESSILQGSRLIKRPLKMMNDSDEVDEVDQVLPVPGRVQYAFKMSDLILGTWCVYMYEYAAHWFSSSFCYL